jgi:hypothetical protein
MESMRRIEVNYTLSSEELEYMRMGRFVRMHANGNFMSFDDFCEKHNETDTEPPRYKCDVCRKSRHLHLASRCAKMVFGFEGKSKTCATLATDDIRALYLYFSNCEIFSNRVDTPSNLNDSVFMTNAVPDRYKNKNSDAKKKIEGQRCKPLSTREKRHLSLNGDDSEDDDGDDVKSDNDNDDDDDNDDISCNLMRCIDSDDELENNSVDGVGSICGSVVSTDDRPKNVVNGNKRKLTKLEKNGLLDVFSLESIAVKKAIGNQLRKINDDTEFENTIRAAVDHFQQKVATSVATLERRHEERQQRIDRDETADESQVRQSIERFFTDHAGYPPN